MSKQFDHLNSVSQLVNRKFAYSFNRGRRAERAEVLQELKRIAGFPEMGARYQLDAYIKHLEGKE